MDLVFHLDIAHRQMELHHNNHLDDDFFSSYVDTLQYQLQNHIMKVLIQITVLCRNCAYLDIGGKMDDHIHRIRIEDTSYEEASSVEGKDTDTGTSQATSFGVEDSNTSARVIAMSIVGSHFFYYSLKQAVTFGISLLELIACDSSITSEVSHFAS